MIDESKFSVTGRYGEFYAVFRVEGEIRVQIKADSIEQARAKAREIADGDDFGTELDEVIDVNIDYVYAARPMYRVTRDGSKMQVSRLEDGDIPREPDERGF